MNEACKNALIDLLFQLADDDFLYAFRGSEWLGLVPHIEEDVASASITQDSMGHSSMYYSLLEELGLGPVDVLSHARKAEERKNCVLVEKANGSGHYMEEPHYDWAYAVCRNYLYTVAKKVKVAALKKSAYQPLAHIAAKVEMELYYHEAHWRTWFTQLACSNQEAAERMKKALQRVMDDWHDVFSLGAHSEKIVSCGFLVSEKELQANWEAIVLPLFSKCRLHLPASANPHPLNGRLGEHSADLNIALAILSEVYLADQQAIW
ncbi:1,2-phenylacetyl-CoA epoxidase subunit PaaC [Bacillus testis]|uniref:1,2-phenylacetyl-CoA epoxidase subunit PaaC n=1 Tax=Bacillus testis TaxID=1622072 RepID=UPI00067E9B43|nr:1,2-phenylacetyl-CoA epoxidase subunit PaaC [Bacillus testis]